ncbi:MAG: DUF4982 domain-containing protein, partial [Gemmatimonadales bacterium]
NLDRVELFLNGASQGVREIPKNGHAMWKVPYAAGAIEARGYRGTEVVLTDRRETTGAPAAVRLRADRTTVSADGEDVAVLTAEIVDAAGRVVSTADNEVTFSVSEDGALIGVGNGDPSSHESDRGPARRAFNGLCCAIIQTSRISGEIQVQGSAEGLASGKVTLTSAAATPRPYLPSVS